MTKWCMKYLFHYAAMNIVAEGLVLLLTGQASH